MTELRDYQIEAVADFNRERAAGKRRIILVAPTASGKTVIGAAIIKQADADYRNVLVLAPTWQHQAVDPVHGASPSRQAKCQCSVPSS
jgi:superfamily II DNA or RNA helicase